MHTTNDLLTTLHKEYTWQKVTIGESGAETYYLYATHQPSIYLKIASCHLLLNLEKESKLLEWVKHKLPVPKVIAFFIEDDKEHLVTTALPGINMAGLVEPTHKAALVKLLADGLKLIHQVPVDKCPFDHRIQQEIRFIQERVKLNLIDESDFDQSRIGRKVSDLLEELFAKIPQSEEVVFTHGDYCLPNIIVKEDGQLSGFVDLNRAGVGDRYRDLALACRSIAYNFGKEWVKVFFDQYGLQPVDNKKIAFYQLVDEFF